MNTTAAVEERTMTTATRNEALICESCGSRVEAGQSTQGTYVENGCDHWYQPASDPAVAMWQVCHCSATGFPSRGHKPGSYGCIDTLR